MNSGCPSHASVYEQTSCVTWRCSRLRDLRVAARQLATLLLQVLIEQRLVLYRAADFRGSTFLRVACSSMPAGVASHFRGWVKRQRPAGGASTCHAVALERLREVGPLELRPATFGEHTPSTTTGTRTSGGKEAQLPGRSDAATAARPIPATLSQAGRAHATCGWQWLGDVRRGAQGPHPRRSGRRGRFCRAIGSPQKPLQCELPACGKLVGR